MTAECASTVSECEESREKLREGGEVWRDGVGSGALHVARMNIMHIFRTQIILFLQRVYIFKHLTPTAPLHLGERLPSGHVNASLCYLLLVVLHMSCIPRNSLEDRFHEITVFCFALQNRVRPMVYRADEQLKQAKKIRAEYGQRSTCPKEEVLIRMACTTGPYGIPCG